MLWSFCRAHIALVFSAIGAAFIKTSKPGRSQLVQTLPVDASELVGSRSLQELTALIRSAHRNGLVAAASQLEEMQNALRRRYLSFMGAV